MHGTLYLDHRNVQLSLQGKSLRIHRDGIFERSIPLNQIDQLVCQSRVALDTSLLANLASQGIGVTVFGGRHGKNIAHLGISGTETVDRRLGQYRHYDNPGLRLDWSTRLVTHKLLQQQRFLALARRQRADQRLALTRGLAPIKRLAQQLKSSPPKSIDSLRGLEGGAGHLYFQAYRSLFPDSLGFNSRQRRPPPDPVNAVLSLGYTLLHSDIHKAVESVGLDAWLGIYHEPYHGRESLVCDLVEPFRTRIDELVWRLFRNRILTDEHFCLDDHACLLNKAGRGQFYPGYETWARSYRPLLRMLALKIAGGFQRPPDHPGENRSAA